MARFFLPLIGTLWGSFLLSACGTLSHQSGVRRPDSSSAIRSASRAAASLRSIEMMTPTTGWAATDHRLLYTHDGGRTWTDVTPTMQSRTSHRLLPIWLDRKTAFVIINLSAQHSEVLRTTNAGQSWHTMGAFPVFLNRKSFGLPQFVSPAVGWVVVRSRGAAGTEQIVLDRTHNGGHSWHTVFSDYNQPMGGGAGDIGSITFLNAHRGWMSGSDTGAGQVYLLETQNGGRSWSPQSLPIPASISRGQWRSNLISTGRPQFFGPTRQLGILPVTVGDQLWIYHTVDGGHHWTPTILAGHSPPGTSVTAIDFVTPLTGFVWTAAYTDHPPVKVRSRLWNTTNGGTTWQVVINHLPPGYDAHLDFISPALGWALIDHALWRTSDGGRRWILMSVPLPSPSPTQAKSRQS